MNAFAAGILGIGVALIGGRLGLRRLLYLTVAFAAGFASVSITKAFFSPVSSRFEALMSEQNAAIVSLLLLVLTPMTIVAYAGRRLVVRLQVLETIHPMIDAILGSGYLLTAYIAVLRILGG